MALNYSRIILFVMFFVFMFGGIFQYLGILSYTQSNYLLLFFLAPVFIFKITSFYFFNTPYAVFVAFWLLMCFCFFNGTVQSYLVYFYYFLCLFFFGSFGYYIGSFFGVGNVRISFQSAERLLRLFFYINLLAVTFQSTFSEIWISFSKIEMWSIDSVYGTLFVKSDSALTFLCAFALIYAIRKFAWASFFKLFFVTSSIVLQTNSDLGEYYYWFVGLTVILWRLECFSGSKGPLLFFAGISLFVSAIAFLVVQSGSDFYDYMRYDYFYNEHLGFKSRMYGFWYSYFEGFMWLGLGPLTYYNPTNAEWLFNAGLSTIYSLYIDFGFLFLIALYIFVFHFTFHRSRNYLISFLLFLGFFLFSITNFVLTDACFLMAYAMLCRVNHDFPKMR